MTPNSPPRDEFKTSLQGCARCGGNHDAVIFKRLQKPVKVTMTGAKNDDYEEELANFWGLCPATGEPMGGLLFAWRSCSAYASSLAVCRRGTAGV